MILARPGGTAGNIDGHVDGGRDRQTWRYRIRKVNAIAYRQHRRCPPAL